MPPKGQERKRIKKNLRKVMVLVLALLVVFAFSAVAFAAEVTVRILLQLAMVTAMDQTPPLIQK